ncbi:MAG: Gfo/Idh/MocA family oxidoreductase [Chloroflexota bacterium]
MEKARIGIIGTGWWTTTAHIPALMQNPNAELVALADKRKETLDKATACCQPVKAYLDYREMLAKEKLDGVIVAVNHTAHYEVAKAVLDAGLHLLLEKPMVLEAAEAYELMDLANHKGKELIVGYPWHYTARTKQARDIVQSGELGAIQYVSSLFTSMTIEFYRNNAEAYRPTFGYPVTGPGTAYSDPKLAGGGQGHLQITHSAAAMFFVTGLQADRVSSFMENWDVPVDLVDAISVRFKPVKGNRRAVGVLGSTGNIDLPTGGEYNVNVYCENGYLFLNEMDGTVTVHKNGQPEQHFAALPPEDRYPSFATSQNLVDVILGKAENGSPAIVGVRVVELLDAAYRSAAADGQAFSVGDLVSVKHAH